MNGFVRNASEIAWEILQKAALLPDGVKAFKARMNEKRAAAKPDPLSLPAQTDLEDLQKLAHENKTDLPVAGPVSSDDYTKIAASLRTLVQNREREDGLDILADAAAIAAQKVAARGGIPTATIRPKAPRMGGGGAAWQKDLAPMTAGQRLMGHLNPLGENAAKLRQRKAVINREVAKAKSETPGTEEHAISRGAEGLAEHSKAKSEFAEKALATVPAVALPLGIGVGGAALLSRGGKEKKEEVKIYK